MIFALTILYGLTVSKELSEKYKLIISQEIMIRDILREISVELLMSRRNEKDFLLRKDKKYISNVEESVKKMTDYIQTIDKFSDVLKIQKKDIEVLYSSVNAYHLVFKKVADLVNQEGNYSSGTIGIIIEIQNELEKTLKENENLSSFYKIKSLSSDYILSGDPTILNSLVDKINNFREDLINPSELEHFNSLKKSYLENFDTYTKNKKIIKEEINNFRGDIHNIENFIKEKIEIVNLIISDEIDLLNSLYKRNFQLSMISGLLSISVFFAIILFYLKISKNISVITEQLKNTSDDTLKSSKDLRKTSDELSSSTQEQSSAIIQTVSTLDEIREMMRRSVDNASFSEKKSNESHDVASSGKKAVSEVVAAINSINECNNNISNQMSKTSYELEQIVKVIKEISSKTKVINDIVFQTKLLSFNASIEAARAGKHGQGFSVVAEEVGKLAVMSGNASKEIENLISSSVDRVESIVKGTTESVNKLIEEADLTTKTGVDATMKCDDILNQVVENVYNVKKLMKEIFDASSEQSIGVENISKAMNELDQVTQTTTSIAFDSSKQSNNLEKQTDELNSVVYILENIINGKKV